MTIINSLGGIHGLFPGQKPRIVFVGKESVFTTPLVHYFTTHNISEFAGVLPNNPHLAEKTLSADILISACGKPCSITQEMVKAGAVVIDVGIYGQRDRVAIYRVSIRHCSLCYFHQTHQRAFFGDLGRKVL